MATDPPAASSHCNVSSERKENYSYGSINTITNVSSNENYYVNDNCKNRNVKLDKCEKCKNDSDNGTVQGTSLLVASVVTEDARREYGERKEDSSSDDESKQIEGLPTLGYDSDETSNDNDDDELSNSDEGRYIRVQYRKDYPPNLREDATAGVYNPNSNNYTNSKLSNGRIDNNVNVIESNNIEYVYPSENEKYYYNIFSNEYYTILPVQETDDIYDVYVDGKVKYINGSNDQWYINVPIKYENGETIKTPIFADSGANSACINLEYAFKHFPKSICHNNDKATLKVPGDFLSPEYCLWMTFPTKYGTILKVKMYLIEKLPIDILADINMLKAFGYSFKDETPPIFRHDETPDIDFELPTEMLTNRKSSIINTIYSRHFGSYNLNYRKNFNWFNNRKNNKTNQLFKQHTCLIQQKEKIHFYDKVKGNCKLLYDNKVGNTASKAFDPDTYIKICKTIEELEEETSYGCNVESAEGQFSTRNVYDEEDWKFNYNMYNDINVCLLQQEGEQDFEVC